MEPPFKVPTNTESRFQFMEDTNNRLLIARVAVFYVTLKVIRFVFIIIYLY